MGIADHLTCLLRNLYAFQEATVRTTWNNRLVPNWEMRIPRLYIVTCLFNLCAEYIMRNARLDEAQVKSRFLGEISIPSNTNINNLKYAGDTTLMAESKELKSLLMKVKEEGKNIDLKLNIQETKIMASGPITLWQTDGKTVETGADFIFFVLQNHCRW